MAPAMMTALFRSIQLSLGMRENTGNAKAKTDQNKDLPNQLLYFVNKQISKTHNAVKTCRKVTTSETRTNYGSCLEAVDEFDEDTVRKPA